MPLIIKSDELIQVANRLDRISRSDLPIAARSTLNTMAFRMKQTEIERSAKKEFDYSRNKTFIRSMSGFSKATGFNMKTMESEAGIIQRAGRQRVAKGLANQEEGRPIKQRLTPLSRTRPSGNLAKKVSSRNKLDNLNSIDARGKKGYKFIIRARRAYRTKQTLKVKGHIARVTSFRDLKNGSARIKMNLIWRTNKNNTIRLKKDRPFIRNAYIQTMKGFDEEFLRQADRRLKK